MNHTPGTWKAWTKKDYAEFISDDEEAVYPFYVVVFEDDDPDWPWIVADIPGGFDQKDETEANARLISAAPDLLEACENLENDDGSIPDHAWKMVQDAIAKAKGGAS